MDAVPSLTRDTIRFENLAQLAVLVLDNSPISRTDLIRLSGLSRSAVFGATARLIELGVVEEEADGVSRVGRPASLLAPSERLAAVTVTLDIDGADVAAVTGRGTVLAGERLTVRDSSPELLSRSLGAWTTGFSLENPEIVVVGIGVAVPGLVDQATGVVHSSEQLDWIKVPFAHLLTKASGRPVVLDNNARLAALAFSIERYASSNFIYLLSDYRGIGAGIRVDGHMVRGSRGIAGEVGHVPLVGTRPAEKLESLVSHELTAGVLDLPSGDLRGLYRSIRTTHDVAAIDHMRSQAHQLGLSLGGLINVLNPDQIILGGFLAPMSERFAGDLEAGLRSTSLSEALTGLTLITNRDQLADVRAGALRLAMSAHLLNAKSSRFSEGN